MSPIQIIFYIFFLFRTTIQDAKVYNNFDRTDAEALRHDLLDEGNEAAGSTASHYAGANDFLWYSYDSLNIDATTPTPLPYIKITLQPNAVSPCIFGLFELPSGGKYCRVSASIKKTASDAHAFCKAIGLSGLLELDSDEDVVKVAGINAFFDYQTFAYIFGGKDYMIAAAKHPDVLNMPGFYIPPWKSYPSVVPTTEADTWYESRYMGAKYDLTTNRYHRLSDGAAQNFTGFNLVNAYGTPNPPLAGPGYLAIQCCDPWTNQNLMFLRLYQLNAVNFQESLVKKFLCGKSANDQSCPSGTFETWIRLETSPCTPLLMPTNLRLKQISFPSGITTETNRVVQCNRYSLYDYSKKNIANNLIGGQLPRLRRASISFHHICGTFDLKNDTCGVSPCNFTVLFSKYDPENSTSSLTSLPVFTPPAEKTFNNGTVSTIDQWFFERVQLPHLLKGTRLTFNSEFDTNKGAIGFDNIHIQTQQKCLPRWSVIQGFKFTAGISKISRMSLSDFEYTAIVTADLQKRFYMATISSVKTLEYCSRLCLLGSNCDMFQYGSDQTCSLIPHNSMKEQNLYDVITRDTANPSVYSIYALQCSTPSENVLRNTDLSAQTYEGWTISTNCNDYGIYEKESKASSRAAVNGGNQYQHYTICDMGETFSISQELGSELAFPYGMNRAYLAAVRPSAIVRTWISQPKAPKDNHFLNLTVLFSTILDGIVDAKTQRLSTDVPKATPPISSDYEFSIFLQNFADFDTVSVSQDVTSSDNTATIYSGPPELIVDVPFEMGCYQILTSTQMPAASTTTDLTPASCIVKCLGDAKRFAGLAKGTDCLCFDSVPIDFLQQVKEEDSCNVACVGDANYMCGGQNVIQIYVATCPTGQIRHGDSCFQEALASDTDIFKNTDLCADKNSNLWFPETSLEMTFVTANFPTLSNLYHLGISQYHAFYGALFSDNSFGVGVPFFTAKGTGDDLLNAITKLQNTPTSVMLPSRCVVFDASANLWTYLTPCGNAKGVCKSKLGFGQGYQKLASQLEYRMETSLKSPAATAFTGTNPIHIQLENDLNRFVQLTFAKQVVVAGLSIQTPEKMALESFTFSYAGLRIQEPNVVSVVSQVFSQNSLVFIVKNHIDNTSATVINRNIYLPTPVVADLIRLSVRAGALPLVLKFDVIGMDPAKKYATDPMLSPVLYRDYQSVKIVEYSSAFTVGSPNPGKASLIGQNVCPGGSVYFRLQPQSTTTANADGGSATINMILNGSPKTLILKFSVNPLSIAIKSDASTILATVNLPTIAKSFDLLVTCEVDSFKIFANGQPLTSVVKFHGIRDSNNNIVYPIVYKVMHGLMSPLVLGKLSWTYIPPNGILSTIVSLPATSPTSIFPAISSFDFLYQSTVQDHSTLVGVYQDSAKKETRYQPVQALQNCYRSGQGNVKCNTIEATFSQLALTTGFGGNNGYGALGCPSGYMGVGNICIRFPAGSTSAVGTYSSFFDAIGGCGMTGDLLYSPINAIQNAVVKAALAIWNVDVVWLNVQKDPATNVWKYKNSIPLTGFEADWDSNEPANALGANCAVMLQSAGYKWRAVNCNGPAKYMCMVKVPNCPNGYTWLYQFGQSCFKVTPEFSFVVGTNTIAEHPVANSICAQENTRLAVAETADESTSLLTWLNKNYVRPGASTKAKYYMGYRMFGAEKNVTFETRNYVVPFTTLNTTLISVSPYYSLATSNCANYFDSSWTQNIYADLCRVVWTSPSSKAYSVNGICQYVEGDTTSNLPCVFPFRYKGRMYDRCITHANYGVPWCATSTDINNEMISGQRGNCLSGVKANDCPVGFRWVYPEATCYRYSTPLPQETVTSFVDAEAKCMQWGARLYQPRSTAGLAYLKVSENLHLNGELFGFASAGLSLVAIGIYYQQHPGDDTSYFYYSDGMKVTELMSTVLKTYWKVGYPVLNGGKCIALQQMKFINVPCDNSEKSYYAYVANDDASTNTKSVLGYLCETRPITTQGGGDLCQFPFQYQGKTYTSCALENNTLLGNNGAPWCATEVGSNGIVINGKWALCQDERTIIYDGNGAGSFCPMPFLYNRQFYDTCTRKSSTLPIGFETDFWCPDPSSVNLTQQNLFSAGGKIGRCNNFLIPPENGCNDQYEGTTDSLCIRVSSYPETYDNAQARCNLEGGQLLQVTSAAIHQGILTTTSAKLLSIPRFKGIKQMWIGADYSNSTKKWQWTGNIKLFSDFTLWEAAVSDIGCYASGCTPADGLVVRPDSNFLWNAVVDKSKPLPYICMSNCVRGYLWFPNVGKCLKVVHSKDQNVTIGQAMVACSSEQARLVPIKSCAQITKLVKGIFDQFQLIGQEYFVGISNSKNATGISDRNWEPIKLMDSLGYGIDRMDPPLAPCALTTTNEAYVSVKVMSRSAFTTTANSFTSPISIGYICEKENLWGCPPGYIMMEMNCYKMMRNPKIFAEAEVVCKLEGGFLAKPITLLQGEFLQGLIKYSDALNNNVSERTWINYRSEFGEDEPYVYSVPGATINPVGISKDCFAYTNDLATGATPLKRTFCSQPSNFICQMEQSLSQIFQPFLPAPVGLWPLSKSLGPVDVTTNKIPTNESWIAYDPLYTPAGLLGSPMFTKELNFLSFIQIFPSAKLAVPISQQISILGWIRPDVANEGVILSWRNETQNMGLTLVKTSDHFLALSLSNSTSTLVLKSLESYKMVVGQWSFFAIVLDGISKRGLIQIDYAYGYNNGTTDFKMEYFNIPSFDWFDTMFTSPLVVGSSLDKMNGFPFHGSISCLQMFANALNPGQIQYKSNCTDASAYITTPCLTGYQLYDGICIMVSSATSQFATAQVGCMPSATDFHRSQLLSPYNHRHIEYALAWANYQTNAKSIWVGCDDSDDDDKWINSLGAPMSLAQVSATFYNQTSHTKGGCCLYQSGNSGYLVTDDCSMTYAYSCESTPLYEAQTYPCPNGFFPFKNECLHPNQLLTDYDTATLNCASKGSYIMPIKDQGFYAFVAAWAAKVVPMDIWIGLRQQTIAHKYNDQEPVNPLITDTLPTFSYADGTSFDLQTGYKIGATKLSGECLFLKQSSSYGVMDSKCNKLKGFICQWRKPTCPNGYDHMGQLSDGRTCYGSPVTAVASATNTCPNPTQDLLRKQWIPQTPYEADRFRRTAGQVWINAYLMPDGNWTTDSLRMVTSQYTDQRISGDWVPTTTDQVNITGCLEMTSTGLFWPVFNQTCTIKKNPQSCEYKACMTTLGKQCIFPFTYKNESSPVLEYNVCSTLDIYKPWCPTQLSSTGGIVEWGECLPDCPQEEVSSVCIMEPEYPMSSDGAPGTANFTSNYVFGSGYATRDLDYVYYTCPEGYVFEGSKNVTHYAVCRNWKFVYLFDITKGCVAVKCPNPPPFFPPKTVQGTWTWDKDLAQTSYSTTIDYSCPEGFVFQIYQDFPDPSINNGLIVNETSTLTGICALWGDWQPPKLPICIAKNCSSNPVMAPNNDKGMFNWDANVKNKSYSLTINYWCPKPGWGYPSTGLNNITNICQADKTWNMTQLEDCILLPCPNEPPKIVDGGWMWYGVDYSRYKCPNGLQFSSGNYPYWYSNCTIVRAWDPTAVEPCVPRLCSDSPPLPWVGIDMDWPLKQKTLNTKITYTCPFKTKTNLEELAVQYSQCIWDKDTDEMVWYPNEIDVCNKTIPPTGDIIIVLPTLPPYTIQYSDTADYYWPLISDPLVGAEDPSSFVNADGKTSATDIVAGPFGFGDANILDTNRCIVKSRFGIRYDTCILDPSNCKNGLSFAVWEKVFFPKDIFNLEMFHKRTYIVSTGGDYNTSTNVSYPGFSIYHIGMDISLVMVTKTDVYDLKVRGQLVNNTWTNVGFRFINYIDSSTIPYLSRGGLELFINGLKVGLAVVPLDRPAGGWKATTVLKPQPGDASWAGIDATEPILMVGCHRNLDDRKFRDFCMPNTKYDEMTFWTRRLGANASVDETLFFTGGYVPAFDGVSPDDWKNMLSRVELSDPSQLQMAGVISKMMAGVQAKNKSGDTSDIFNRTGEAKLDYDAQKLKFGTAFKLLDLTGLKLLDRAKYLTKRFSILSTASSALEDTPGNIAGWASVYSDPNEQGASYLVRLIEEYVLKYAGSANILHDESYPGLYSSNRSEFLVHSQSPGLVMSTTKTFPSRFASYGDRLKLDEFYATHPVSPTNQWYDFLESIEIPTSWAYTNQTYCQNQPFTLLTAIYDGYGKMAPVRRAPQFIPSPIFKIDSRVVSVKMAVNPNPLKDLTQNFSSCNIDHNAMKYNPVRIRFYHYDNQTSLRKLLWHEDELQTNVDLRRCVVFNENIGISGAWESEDCTTVMTDQLTTICECATFGTFAVEAEIVDPAKYGLVFTWVGIVKYMGYFFSLITLIIFFLTIALTNELWDQFHILRCNTGFACFISLLSMLITEIESIRIDRHSNIAISVMQQYWFQTTSYFLFSESFATFRAITGGIIGGKTLAYVPLSYGLPLIDTGVALYLYGSDFGTDPRAFIGWENTTKLIFFYSQLTSAGISLLLCLVIVFNIALPQTRKDSIVDQLSAQGTGLFFMVFIFCMTWGFAYPAYIRDPTREIPDFFPIFMVLNSWSGVFVFCLLGIFSKPFRRTLFGGGGLRANPLFAHMQSNKKGPEEDGFHELSRTPSSTSLASVPDSLDEDIEKGLPDDVTEDGTKNVAETERDNVTKNTEIPEESVQKEPEKKKEDSDEDSDQEDSD